MWIQRSFYLLPTTRWFYTLVPPPKTKQPKVINTLSIHILRWSYSHIFFYDILSLLHSESFPSHCSKTMCSLYFYFLVNDLTENYVWWLLFSSTKSISSLHCFLFSLCHFGSSHVIACFFLSLCPIFLWYFPLVCSFPLSCTCSSIFF